MDPITLALLVGAVLLLGKPKVSVSQYTPDNGPIVGPGLAIFKSVQSNCWFVTDTTRNDMIICSVRLEDSFTHDIVMLDDAYQETDAQGQEIAGVWIPTVETWPLGTAKPGTWGNLTIPADETPTVGLGLIAQQDGNLQIWDILDTTRNNIKIATVGALLGNRHHYSIQPTSYQDDVTDPSTGVKTTYNWKLGQVEPADLKPTQTVAVQRQYASVKGGS